MKTLRSAAACLALLFLGVGQGHALTFTDFYDAGHTYLRGSLFGRDDSVSWSFDITEHGFVPLEQEIVEANVILSLEDDSGWFDLAELARLDLGENVFRWEVDTGEVPFLLTSLMTLSATGVVDCTLRAMGGDFFFNSATLQATGASAVDLSVPDPVVPSAPEPATMLLFGSGLVGIAFMGRRLSVGPRKERQSRSEERPS